MYVILRYHFFYQKSIPITTVIFYRAILDRILPDGLIRSNHRLDNAALDEGERAAAFSQICGHKASGTALGYALPLKCGASLDLGDYGRVSNAGSCLLHEPEALLLSALACPARRYYAGLSIGVHLIRMTSASDGKGRASLSNVFRRA